MPFRSRFVLPVVCGIFIAIGPLYAQTNTCGVVDSVNFPVDTTVFTLVQDFAAPNLRHEGAFHTGEDWYGGRGTSYGQPVRAAMAGQVTYASANGWGADGGVVILEHRLPDNSTIYTLYGHLAPTATMPFPEKLTCVTAGQIIGSIADVRPAPHLHFEVRLHDPDVPGPGYTAENPYDLGWRQPSKFILNQQLALQRAHEWSLFVDEGAWTALNTPFAPPLVLNDNSLLYLDSAGTTLRRATADGRILWRVEIEQAVSITPLKGQAIVTLANGQMNPILNYETGRLGEGWRVEAGFTGAPIPAFDWLIFPAENHTLVAIGEDRRSMLWRMENIPPFVRWQVAGDRSSFIIGLITADNEFILLSGSGGLIDRKPLRQTGALAAAPDGTMLVYSQGGLWRVGLDGLWSLYLPDAPVSTESRALLTTPGGRLFVFDGAKLHAYTPEKTPLWATDIGIPVTGRTELALYETTLFLMSNGGALAAISDGGRVCNRTRIYGNNRARLWQSLGDDGTLRLAVADQMVGLDWQRFITGC